MKSKGKIKEIGLLASFLALSYFSGCALGPEIELIHPSYYEYMPERIAVLPMDNMVPDLDATSLVRAVLAQRLSYKGYSVVPLEEVDRILKDNGVMISHDVYMFTPAQLGEMLNCDAVVYGTVTEFANRYAVIYSQLVVGVKFQMLHCKTGERLWETEHYSGEDTALQSLALLLSERDIAEALGKIAVYNAMVALLSSLRPYAEKAVREALVSLPGGRLGQKPCPWDLEQKEWENDWVKIWIKEEPKFRTYTTLPPKKPMPNKPAQKPDTKPSKPPASLSGQTSEPSQTGEKAEKKHEHHLPSKQDIIIKKKSSKNED